jgi:hypothetical protein
MIKDEKFQAEVLEKHSEHVCKIAAGISVLLASLKPAFVEQQGAAAPYTIGLLEELAALQKIFDAETPLFSHRLTLFLKDAKRGTPSS